MYNITLYENGLFITHIGGEIQTLPEALAQLEKTASAVAATELKHYVGYRFDRSGTECVLLITDVWNEPITREE